MQPAACWLEKGICKSEGLHSIPLIRQEGLPHLCTHAELAATIHLIKRAVWVQGQIAYLQGTSQSEALNAYDARFWRGSDEETHTFGSLHSAVDLLGTGSIKRVGDLVRMCVAKFGISEIRLGREHGGASPFHDRSVSISQPQLHY